MRFPAPITRTPPRDVCAPSRRRRRFLLLPKCVAGEWRWLERAAWVEHYVCDWYAGADPLPSWVAVRWVD